MEVLFTCAFERKKIPLVENCLSYVKRLIKDLYGRLFCQIFFFNHIFESLNQFGISCAH